MLVWPLEHLKTDPTDFGTESLLTERTVSFRIHETERYVLAICGLYPGVLVGRRGYDGPRELSIARSPA